MPIEPIRIETHLIDHLATELDKICSDRRVTVMALCVIIGRWAVEEAWTDKHLVETFVANVGIGRGEPPIQGESN